jgi:hypothetical protein
LQFAFWGIVLLMPLLYMGTEYEWRQLQGLKGQMMIAGLLALPAIAIRWWAARDARGAEAMKFEETEESEIVSLGLPADSVALHI